MGIEIQSVDLPAVFLGIKEPLCHNISSPLFPFGLNVFEIITDIWIQLLRNRKLKLS